MIGRPGEPARYGALHQQMKLLPNLDYLGEQPIERVNSEIAASDVLVTTSYEGFPNTFIQAWLRGVPVVSNGVDPDLTGTLVQSSSRPSRPWPRRAWVPASPARVG